MTHMRVKANVMRVSTTVLTSLIASAVYAAPPKVPEKVEVAVGEDYVLTVEIPSDAEIGMAKGFDPKDCTFFGPVTQGNKRDFLVRPKKDGKFYVTFWTKGETDFKQTIISTVGGGGGGDDTPPTDQFTKSLLAAYAKEPGDTRVQDAKALAAVYRRLATAEAIHSASITNEDQLLSLIVNARSAMIGERLPNIRETVASQYASAFTGNPGALVTHAQKTKVSDTLLKAATVLEGVK